MQAVKLMSHVTTWDNIWIDKEVICKSGNNYFIKHVEKLLSIHKMGLDI